jgi:hypothetical protein
MPALPYFVTRYHVETLARLVALASRPRLRSRANV